jgi:ribosome maturation factor RimP
MRTAPANVHKLIEPVVSSLGYELVGIEFLQGKGAILRVYIDHESGIKIDDCERVSHQLSGLLDVEDVIKGRYALEVSSPGLDRPLFTLDQFQRFVGSEVRIRLVRPIEGRRNFHGVLLGIEKDDAAPEVVLEMDGTQVRLPFNDIDKANLVPQI